MCFLTHLNPADNLVIQKATLLFVLNFKIFIKKLYTNNLLNKIKTKQNKTQKKLKYLTQILNNILIM